MIIKLTKLFLQNAGNKKRPLLSRSFDFQKYVNADSLKLP